MNLCKDCNDVCISDTLDSGVLKYYFCSKCKILSCWHQTDGRSYLTIRRDHIYVILNIFRWYHDVSCRIDKLENGKIKLVIAKRGINILYGHKNSPNSSFVEDMQHKLSELLKFTNNFINDIDDLKDCNIRTLDNKIGSLFDKDEREYIDYLLNSGITFGYNYQGEPCVVREVLI